MKKSKQEIQIEAVKAIISGELHLEEAMSTYNVKDKRTMLAWIRKVIPLINVSEPKPNMDIGTAFDSTKVVTAMHSSSQATSRQDILRENSLQKKVINLQDKVQELEDVNAQLARHRNLLLEKVTSLELRIQIYQKDVK